jgi:long-chain acyl-CoA synthetase
VNLLEMFLAGAAKDPAKVASTDEGVELTYGTIVKFAKGVASILANATDKEAVGIFLPTSNAFIVTYVATLMAGKAILPFNLLLSPEDLLYVAKDSGIDTIVTSRKVLDVLGRKDDVLKAAPNIIYLEDLAGTKLKKVRVVMKGLFFRPKIVGEDELGMLLYTSGTIGRPKGVRLSHRNVGFDIEACLKVIEGVDENTVMVQLLPLFHTFALTATLGVPTYVGGSMVPVKRFSPEPVLDAIEKHRITHLVAIPSMFRVLNRSQTIKPRDTKSLKVAISGGEPLPAEVRDKFEEIFGLPITEGYGLTETSPVVSVNPLGRNKPGSVGPPLPGVEVAIRDGEGKELPRGSVGEICVKGPIVMMGYQNRPADTSVVLGPDGWLATGDMGRIDDDGYIWITGRKKEMMIVGGENVFPAEIEDVLCRHPYVADVGVIGVKDERRGEVPKAFVVLSDEGKAKGLAPAEMEMELKRFCHGKLPLFKIPRHIVFKDELPKAPTGKVLRRKLREEEETLVGDATKIEDGGKSAEGGCSKAAEAG